MISLILKKLFYFEDDANYRKMVPYFPYETMADTGTLESICGGKSFIVTCNNHVFSENYIL